MKKYYEEIFHQGMSDEELIRASERGLRPKYEYPLWMRR